MRLIRTELTPDGSVIAAKVYRNADWNEYVVKPLDGQGSVLPEECWDYVDTKVEALQQSAFYAKIAQDLREQG
ncbi:hypothetical protein [uncultured Paraglaciecola sp.]|uniref:hypothetical protein n=1 Tax=uncultured Paraglaciecola sp. TaxID=1765024 RepID=UPI00262786C1|nr:hypothetical protein [uncultured Paraglaciecola sp.]